MKTGTTSIPKENNPLAHPKCQKCAIPRGYGTYCRALKIGNEKGS